MSTTKKASKVTAPTPPDPDTTNNTPATVPPSDPDPAAAVPAANSAEPPAANPSNSNKVMIPDNLTANLPAELTRYNSIKLELPEIGIIQLLLGNGCSKESIDNVLQHLQEAGSVTLDRVAKISRRDGVIIFQTPIEVAHDLAMNGIDSLYLAKVMDEIEVLIQHPCQDIQQQDEAPVQDEMPVVAALSNLPPAAQLVFSWIRSKMY